MLTHQGEKCLQLLVRCNDHNHWSSDQGMESVRNKLDYKHSSRAVKQMLFVSNENVQKKVRRDTGLLLTPKCNKAEKVVDILSWCLVYLFGVVS